MEETGQCVEQGCGNLQAEAQRLKKKLASFSTSEGEDRALFKTRAMQRDWRERMVVEFRIQRKQALRLTIEGITEEAPLQSSADPIEILKRQAKRSKKRKPKVVVPLSDLSDELEEPKFVQLATDERSEL